MVLVGDVMAEMAERLFDTAAVHRVQADHFQIRRGLAQGLERMGGLIGADIQLPSEFTDVRDTVRAGQPESQFDFARGAEREAVIVQRIRGHARQHIARIRPHQAQHGFGGGHIGDDGEIIAQVPSQPRQITLHCCGGNHQQIRCFRQAGDRQIAFDAAARVQHLGIDQPPRSDIDIIGADALQETAGIAPLDPDLAEGRHVIKPDILTQGHVLGALVVEPVLRPPGIAVCALLPVLGEPVGALPPRGLAKHRAARLQRLMQRRAADTARGFHLPIGVVIGIQKPQRFRYPLLQIRAVALERLRAADIHLPQIEGGFAVRHPLRQRHARPARRHDADRIIPGGDPVIAQFRRLAQVIAIIGRKAFRAVKERVHASRFKQRQAVHGHAQNGLEMVEILGQAVEFEVLGDAPHAPGLGPGLERAQHHLARVLLVIGAFIGHAQHRQAAQIGHGFGDQVEMLGGVQG